MNPADWSSPFHTLGPALFRLRVLQVIYSQPIRIMSNKLTYALALTTWVMALDDECCSISECYPVPRPLTLNLTLKMTLNIRTKVIFVFSVPNLTFKRVLREKSESDAEYDAEYDANLMDVSSPWEEKPITGRHWDIILVSPKVNAKVRRA